MSIYLHYEEIGNGEPLILLHGNGEDLTYFTHQMDYFSKKYQVIAIDTRGHGKSERGTEPFTIRQFALDLYEFMVEHQIDKANILGFSDGGNIALTFALMHPERILKLILNGANLNGRGVKAHIQIPIVLGYKFASAFAQKSADAKKNSEMLGLMVNDPNIEPSRLQNVFVKTLVIAGTNDMIKKSHTLLIYKNLPNAELVFIEGNHFIANKEYEKFNKAIETFLM